ncbi:MAG TPA: hypothetical protein VFW40_06900, partial [Capsulimonadaceae bacterium]|nr:hypothetical protein [Capsulimonadaceae bacterium]
MSNMLPTDLSRFTFASIFACLLALFGLAAPRVVFAQTPNFIVYDDSLENGCANWGWATLNYSNTSPVHSGNDSISVSAGPNQALYIHANAFNTSPYVSLNFYINGGASGGQQLQVQATIGGTAQTAVPIGPLA